MLQALVNIPASLRPGGGAKGGLSKPPTVTESKRIKKYGSLENYQRDVDYKKYVELSAKAQVIAETQFKDKVVQETYTYSVPDWDKISKNSHISTSAYNYSHMSSSNRAAMDRWFAKNGYMKTVTGTRDKTIPFTLEDSGDQDNSYQDVYEGLTPEMKGFFDKPDVLIKNIKTAEDKLRKENVVLIQDKVKWAQAERQSDRDYVDRKKRDWREQRDKDLARIQKKSHKYAPGKYAEAKQKIKQRYQNKIDNYDEKDDYWQGYIQGLNKGVGQAATFENINSYASDLGRYEERREEARNQNKSQEAAFNQKIETLKSYGYEIDMMTQTAGGKYAGGSLNAYNPRTGDYKWDLKKWKPEDVGGRAPTGIKVGDTTYTVPTKMKPAPAAPRTSVGEAGFVGPVNIPNRPKPFVGPVQPQPGDPGFMGPVRPRKDVITIDAPRSNYDYGQGTKIDGPSTFTMPTNAEQYIAKEKIKDEIKSLDNRLDMIAGTSYTYDYGQGTPTSNPITVPLPPVKGPSAQMNIAPSVMDTPQMNIAPTPEGIGLFTPVPRPNAGKVTYSKPNQIVATPTLTFIGDETAKEKKKLQDQLSFIVEPRTPTLQEVSEMGDQRSTFGTIFGAGDEAKTWEKVVNPVGAYVVSKMEVGKKGSLSGSEVTYATGKILEGDLRDRAQKDFNTAVEEKKEKLLARINVEKYQARVDGGEDTDKVNVELEAEYNKLNTELEKFSVDFQKEWDRKNAGAVQTAGKIYFDTQLYGSAKDTQAKVGTYFGTGAAIGGVAAVGSAIVISTAPVTAPIIAGVGLTAGAVFTGLSYSKAYAAGDTTYDRALATGFTEKEAIQRGLVGAATDVAPFAFTAAGATVGGLLVGGGIQKARKPVTTPKKVSSGVKDLVVKDVILKPGEYMVNGKPVKIIATGRQRISQIGKPGVRIETTTTWRNFLNTRYNADIKPVSTGTPADTRGAAKAINLYRQYGLTTAQAKETIKFTPPKVYDQTITSGFTYGDGNTAIGRTWVQTSTRSMVVDAKQGIRTGVEPTKFSQVTYTRELDPTYGNLGVYREVATTLNLQGGVMWSDAPKVKAGYVSPGAAGKTTLGGKDIPFVRTDSISLAKNIGGPAGYRQDAGSLYLTDVKPVTPSYGKSYGVGTKTPWSRTYPFVDQTDYSAMKGLGMTPTTGTPPVSSSSQGISYQVSAPSMVGGTGDQSGYTTIQGMGLLRAPEPTVSPGMLNLMKVAPPVPTIDVGLGPSFAPSPVLEYGLLTALAPAIALAEPPAMVKVKVGELIAERELTKVNYLYAESPMLIDAMKEDVLIDTKAMQLQAPSSLQSPGQIVSPIQIVQPINIVAPISQTPIDPVTEKIVASGTQPPTIIGIDFGLPRRTKSSDKEQQPFYGEVKVKGKYQRVTEKPHTKSGARDVVARIIDNTVSAQGRLVPMKKDKKKKKTEVKLQQGDGYYSQNQSKFRDFKIVKGQRVNQKNVLIEKMKYRSDTPGEKSGLGFSQIKATGKKGRPKSKKKQPFRL